MCSLCALYFFLALGFAIDASFILMHPWLRRYSVVFDNHTASPSRRSLVALIFYMRLLNVQARGLHAWSASHPLQLLAIPFAIAYNRIKRRNPCKWFGHTTMYLIGYCLRLAQHVPPQGVGCSGRADNPLH